MDPIVLPALGVLSLIVFGKKKSGPTMSVGPITPKSPQGNVEAGEPYVVKTPAPGPEWDLELANALDRGLEAGQKIVSDAQDALKGLVVPGPPDSSEAVAAAAIAEEQLRNPTAQASVDAARGVAQVTPGASLPAGYSRTIATTKAQPMADHLRTKKQKYDRALLKSFQMSAGLKADGLYGPQSNAALRYFGAKSVPAPFVKGTGTYAPPAGG